MALRPFDLGTVYGQAENILAARAARDPNSLQNQLLKGRINALSQGPTASYGKQLHYAVNPDGSLTAYMIGDDGSIKPAELEGGQRWTQPLRPVDMGGYYEVFGGRTGFIDQPPSSQDIPALTITPETQNQGLGGYRTRVEKTIPPEKRPENIAAAEQAKQDVLLKTKPQIAAETIRAEAEATQSLPENVSAAETRLADNLGVIETIDSLLQKDASGKSFLSYAYGRENVILPDVMKAQGWVDAEALRDRVVASLQLENVKKLKGTGPITENEQKILAQAASVLSNPLISPALAEKEARRVNAMFNKWARDNAKQAGQASDTKADPLGIR